MTMESTLSSVQSKSNVALRKWLDGHFLCTKEVSDSPTLPPQAVPLPSTFALQKQTYGLSDSFPMQTSDAPLELGEAIKVGEGEAQEVVLQFFYNV